MGDLINSLIISTLRLFLLFKQIPASHLPEIALYGVKLACGLIIFPGLAVDRVSRLGNALIRLLALFVVLPLIWFFGRINIVRVIRNNRIFTHKIFSFFYPFYEPFVIP